MLNKLRQIKKKITRTLFYFLTLGLTAVFFAFIIFTPVSNIFTRFLVRDFKNSFDNPVEYKFNINPGRILISSVFPGINFIEQNEQNQNQNNNGVNPPFTRDGGADINIKSSEENYNYNPYENINENILIADDDSILSIYDLYELYGSASGVKIEDAAPSYLSDNDIPSDNFRITPGNYSRQQTKTPGLHLLNGVSFDVDLYDYLNREYPIGKFEPEKKEEPVILILNTHTTESYVEDGTHYYSPPFTAGRTTDLNKNVALVSTELRKKLEEYNIPVIQSTRIHDEISFRDSYIRSLETKNEYLEKYPSIKYIIDVHRDSIIAPDGEKFRPAIKINGREAAQLMLVVGTDDGGAYHPNWRDNLTFAVHLQQKMNDRYPMLARPIYVRNARFNQHVTTGTIILEVGSCGSSFSEALYSADLFGQCLAELILENNK